jgi:hypothetical protein
MMTFTQIPARDVRPGALLMTDIGNARIVVAIRDVVERFGTIELVPADAPSHHYGRADMVWAAQR